MKKHLFCTALFLLVACWALMAQPTEGQTYHLQNGASGFKLMALSSGNGADLVQSDETGDLSRWVLEQEGSNYHVRLAGGGGYLSVNPSAPKIGGKKMSLAGSRGDNTLFQLMSQGGGLYRLKSVKHGVYAANAGINSKGASINQVISPAGGANWKFVEVGSAEGPAGFAEGEGSNLSKNYPPLQLQAQSTQDGQMFSIDMGYEVQLIRGSLDGSSSRNAKWLVLQTAGDGGVSPGNVQHSFARNHNDKERGYFIESIVTTARLVSAPAGSSIYKSAPQTTAQTGSTGFSEGFTAGVSFGVEGGNAGGGTGANGNINFSFSYSSTKFSSLDWNDFAIDNYTKTSNATSRRYKLSSIPTIQGGLAPYNDYKSLKNSKDLVSKPLHGIPARAESDFPLYELIIFEFPKTATGTATVEVETTFTVNWVKWAGAEMKQWPKTITAKKQIQVNLADVSSATH